MRASEQTKVEKITPNALTCTMTRSSENIFEKAFLLFGILFAQIKIKKRITSNAMLLNIADFLGIDRVD